MVLTKTSKEKVLATYSKLQKERQFNRIWDFKKQLEKKVFKRIEKESSNENLELALRQYYLNIFGTYRINDLLLYHLATRKRVFFYPIPPEHISVYKKNGIKVFPLTCYLTLYVVSFGLYFRGLLTFISYIRRVLFNAELSVNQKYIYFDKLTTNNLPVQKCGHDSFDIITWFIKWSKTDINVMAHNVKTSSGKYTHLNKEIVKLDGPFPLKNLQKRKFFFKSFILFIKNFFYTLLGRWHHGFMSKETLDELVLNCIRKEYLAEKYLFYNSLTFYRPLWTYVAEKKGAEIISYFYSGGKAIRSPKITSFCDYLPLMNWPKILVWDTYFEEVIRKDIKESTEIQVVGSIDFSFKDAQIPPSKKQILSIFDSPPINVNQHFGFTTSNELQLYKEEYHIKFLNDLIEMGEKHNLDVYIKPKRSNQKFIPKKYMNFLEKISKKPNVIILDGDTSAKKLIYSSTYNVSFPFTATALIGKEFNKKTLYYSPTTLVSKTDPGASGIDFVNSKNDLMLWFKKNSKLESSIL